MDNPAHDPEEQDRPVSARTADADRAFRAAVAGLILWPLQLYALWLVFKVVFGEEKLEPSAWRRTLLAAVIAVLFIIGGSLAASAYLGFPRQDAAEINPLDLKRPVSVTGNWEASVRLANRDMNVTLELRGAGKIYYKDDDLEFTGAWGYDHHGIVYRMEEVTRGDQKKRGKVYLMPLVRVKDDEMVLKLDADLDARFVRK